MYKLDKKDNLILFELDRNSRQSINDLARKTKQSRDVVAYRMKQLEKEEIIQKYITIIDYTKFVHSIIRLYLKLQNTSVQIEEQIISFFINHKATLTIYKTDGAYDLAVGFLVKDLITYQNIYLQFLEKFRPYVAQKNLSFYLDYIHYPRNYLVEKKLQEKSALSTGSFKPFSYDKKDLELLFLINENARITLLELAQKMKMTAAGVKYKLKMLERERVIVAYKLLLDSKKLGYYYYKVDLELEDQKIVPSLNQYIKDHPNVIYRDITVGGSDFEFDCEFSSDEDFYSFLNNLRSLFPGKIRSQFYYRALKIYKYSYFPQTLLSS